MDLGEVCKAIDYYEQSLEIARKIEYLRGEGDALFSMSIALEKLGQRPEAIDRVKAALGIFEQIESPSAERRCGKNWRSGKDKKKTFYHQQVFILIVVARPAAALSGAPQP